MPTKLTRRPGLVALALALAAFLWLVSPLRLENPGASHALSFGAAWLMLLGATAAGVLLPRRTRHPLKVLRSAWQPVGSWLGSLRLRDELVRSDVPSAASWWRRGLDNAADQSIVGP